MGNRASAMKNKREVVSNNHGRSQSDEFLDAFSIEIDDELSQLVDSIQGEWRHRSWRCKIHKVPLELRQRVGKQSENVYDPIMVSLGPYHYGNPKFRRAEEFKHRCLKWYDRNTKFSKNSYYDRILEKIDVIRRCYTEVTLVNQYSNVELATMMLLDACFIINFMEIVTASTERSNRMDWFDSLGVAAIFSFIFRDIMLLENQIPFPVLMLLIKFMYHDHDDDGDRLIERFLRLRMKLEQDETHKENEVPPIHLLEACWRGMMEKPEAETNQQEHNRTRTKFRWPGFLIRRQEKGESTDTTPQTLDPATVHVICSCRSVMELKAKGIHFRPSSHSLMDIKFNSHVFYGQLQLPTRFVSDQTPVILSNMIAYEVSPNGQINPAVLSYVIFMKSLIQSTSDVKELQDKGILLNRLANLDQVVKVFTEIDTFGLVDADVFMEVRSKIEKHCRNKAKTWIADLIHTRFKSPWTAIALFAATFLLCLTFLQTYFTVRPVK